MAAHSDRSRGTLPAMTRRQWRLRVAPAVAALLVAVAFAPVRAAKTVDFDALTIADINHAFDSGALTSEKLVQLCLARIQAYDRQGPSLHAVIALNPKALDTARALDAERKAKGPRSPLHGIPVVLKDNYNTSDMPTTGGSVLLEGSIPPDDAFVVKKLRAAGAIILAKVNMSEFASGGAHSSLGGQSLNPHDLDAHAVGIVGRHRRRHRGGVRAARHGHRHRRFDPRTVHLQRHRRPEADARPAQPRRHHSARPELRHRRADGAQRRRRRRRARRHDRRRSRRRRDEEERRASSRPTTRNI